MWWIFQKLFSNIILVSAIGMLWVAFSVWLSYSENNWLWLSRSGSILVIIGVLMTVRPLVRVGFNDYVKSELTIDCGTITPSSEEIEAASQKQIDFKAFQIGAVYSIIGTIIWAYGDLFVVLCNRFKALVCWCIKLTG